MSEIREWFLIIGDVVLIVALLFLVAFGVIYILDYVGQVNACHTYQSLMPDMSFNVNFWTGCRVQLPDGTYSDATKWLDQNRLNLGGDLNK